MFEGKYYNLEYLEEISAGDKEFILDMLNEFISNAPNIIIEVEELAKNNKWYDLYTIFHRFIPAYDYIGASNIMSEVREIEAISKASCGVEKVPALLEKVKLYTHNAIEELSNDFFKNK